MASFRFIKIVSNWQVVTSIGLSIVVLNLLASSCKRDEKFPSIDSNFANPTDVAADSSGSFFFVLNSDDSRDYNKGSIITLTKDGEKVGVTDTQRLGRSLTVAGSDMLATYSDNGEGTGSKLELYDISAPKSLKLSASWPLNECNPINAVMRSSYKYFAVSCANGQIFIGELATPRSATQLHLVRKYPGARKALHLDTSRNLLIAFATDLRSQVLTDVQEVDATSYTDGGDTDGFETKTPNEIPDRWEENRAQRRNKGRRGNYQYAVYDIAAEAAKQFPYVDDYANVPYELRWTYFSLSNYDGAPDVPVTDKDVNTRYYRTNFWEAKPNPSDDDSFYLSHRGTASSNGTGSQHANSIIKVSIVGDLKPTGTTAPKTEDVLTFERVYGFKGELESTGKHFPCDFEIATVKGSPLLVVNHFRDVKNFPASTYASLASKVLGDNTWFSEIAENTTGHSYYQIAMTPSGRAMAVSFFQNIVILLDAAPGTAITEVKTIN